MDLMKVGVCGRLHAAGVSRPRASEPPSAGVSQKPAGATMKTFFFGENIRVETVCILGGRLVAFRSLFS